MIITKNYDIREFNQYYYVYSYDIPLCPCCGTLLKARDSRKRKVIVDDGETIVFQLRRLQCPCCRTLHLELPDFIEKHKHYSKKTIKQAISGELSSCPADNVTIFRWRKEYLGK